MPFAEHGSLTKEPPLSRIDATIGLIVPGMTLPTLRQAAGSQIATPTPAEAPHRDAPGLLRARFLLTNRQDEIVYDRFLSMVAAHGVSSPLVRKTMYLVWAWRDDRIRRFITEVIADRNGRWSVKRARDKSHSAFFVQFGMASSSQKIRSNYEFFLSEAGILDSSGGVTLRPPGNWLAEAMLVASQHEPDPAIRREMVLDPVGTLFQLGLNGLADLTAGDRATTAVPGPLEALSEEEAERIGEVAGVASAPKPWEDRTQIPPTGGSATAAINLVALERANAAHLMLERLFADALKRAGAKAETTDVIDMLARTTSSSIICEIKSCHAGNFHRQVRHGVSQLLEYRYLYRDQLLGNLTLVLLVECEPSASKRWLVDYLASIGISLVWKQFGGDRLLMAKPVPAALSGIVLGS